MIETLKPQPIHAEAFDLKKGKFDPFGLARSIVEDFMILESLAPNFIFLVFTFLTYLTPGLSKDD